jgi:hypothetical protein
MRRVFAASAVSVMMLAGSLFVATSSNAAQTTGTCTSSFSGPVGYQAMKKIVLDASGISMTQDQFNGFDKNGDGFVCYKLGSPTSNGNSVPNMVDDH